MTKGDGFELVKTEIQTAGRELYGTEWVGELSEREKCLIANYFSPFETLSSQLSMNSGNLRFNGIGKKKTPSGSLREEVERAYSRRDWQNAQIADAQKRIESGALPPSLDSPLSEPYRSGLPGRPSSKQLIDSELREKWSAGERHDSMREWASVLRDWLAKHYPNAPQSGEKAILNNIGPIIRKLKANQPQK